MRAVGRGTAFCVAVLLAAARVASGAGFALFEHSGRGLGSAFAGEAAVAEDASTVYFNPAGLTLLEGTQFVSGAHVIAAKSEFENDGSQLNPRVGTGRLRGPDSEGGEFAFIPTTYISHALTDRVHLGIGANAPFGLGTEWDRQWV